MQPIVYLTVPEAHGPVKPETRWFVFLLAAFLLVNGLTLSRFPAVLVDEIQSSDAAVRFVSGMGFTSAAWFAQNSSRFWAGNVPGYGTLLVGWFSIFGTGLLAERSLNIVLFGLFLVLVWRWLRRSGIVKDPAWRMAAIGLLASSHAMMYAYRSGRYDVPGMILAACAMNLWISEGLAARFLGLFVVGLLGPAAGLQLLPLALLACGLAYLAEGVPALPNSAALLSGCAAGWFGLKLLYQAHGVWGEFQASIHAIGWIGVSVLQKIGELPAAYVADKSRCLMVVATIVLYIQARRRGVGGLRPIRFAWLATFVIPAGLHIVGKFPIYYGWMVYIPLCVAAAGTAAAVWPVLGGTNRVIVGMLLLGAGAVGLPLRLASVAPPLESRNPRGLADFVRLNVHPQETVLADFKLYFALTAAGSQPLLPTYLPAIKPEEKESLSVLLIRPEDVPAAQATLGSEWRPTGATLQPSYAPRWSKALIGEVRSEQYPLIVYRRAASPK